MNETFNEKKSPLGVIEIYGEKFNFDEQGFVRFGDVSRKLLNKQAQYSSRFVDGAFGEYPKLGTGLRFQGDIDDYHSLLIHKDDIEEFVKRYREYQESQKF